MMTQVKPFSQEKQQHYSPSVVAKLEHTGARALVTIESVPHQCRRKSGAKSVSK